MALAFSPVPATLKKQFVSAPIVPLWPNNPVLINSLIQFIWHKHPIGVLQTIKEVKVPDLELSGALAEVVGVEVGEEGPLNFSQLPLELPMITATNPSSPPQASLEPTSLVLR